VKRILIVLGLTVFCGGCFSGCATGSAAKLVKALANDPAGYSLNVDTPWGKVHLVRANPGSNTPPYRLSPDGGVQVLENIQGAAPATSNNDVLMQAIQRIPVQPPVQ